VFPFACGIKPQSPITITPGTGGYPGAYNAVTRRPGELFLLAGSTDGDVPLDGQCLPCMSRRVEVHAAASAL